MQDKGSEDAKPLLEALKSKGFAKIGGVGFCWGGKVIVKLITDPLIQTGVLIHPSHTTLPDIQGNHIIYVIIICKSTCMHLNSFMHD